MTKQSEIAAKPPHGRNSLNINSSSFRLELAKSQKRYSLLCFRPL
jgi:hypothetical protein